MSSHPGSTLKEAVELAEFLRDLGYMPEQVQDFYPTPSTISTCMYYTGLDPRTMEPVYVAVNPHEKAMQRALIQYRNPKNYDLVVEALTKAGRTDLIGFDKHCLIRPRREHPFDRNDTKNDRGNNSHRSSSKNDRDNFHSKNSVKMTDGRSHPAAVKRLQRLEITSRILAPKKKRRSAISIKRNRKKILCVNLKSMKTKRDNALINI